jgi:hypothetical protein
MINVTINNEMKINNKMIITIATACKMDAEPSRSPAGEGFCDTVYLANPCTAIKIAKETAKHFLQIKLHI